MTTILTRFLLPLLLLALLAVPAAARDTLVVGITQFPGTFNPQIDTMLAKRWVLGLTRRPLTAYDPEWRLVCMLCVELPTLENGLARAEDGGVALTFTLHPRATWGDGTPVTTRDVLFTIAAGKQPQGGFAHAEMFAHISRVEARDDKTFTIHFDKLTYDYNDFPLEVLPAHVEQARFDPPVDYRNKTAYDAETTNPALYFGPYRVAEVSRGAHIVLEANPTWYGAPPAFRRVVVRTVESTAALEANLLSGGIDYVAGELGLPLDQAIQLEKRHKDRFAVIYRPGLVFEHLDINLSNPVLADRRVRQALLHGLDRQSLARQLFEGRQPVADSNVNPLDAVHTAQIPTYPYDPDRAAALLDAAGWTLSGGVRRNAAGQPLTLDLMTTAGNRTRELVQQVAQNQWKQLGIAVTIRNEPARVFFGDTVFKRRFPGLALYSWSSAPGDVPRPTLHSKSIPSEANNWSGSNYTGFSNARADALIEAIETEMDAARRQALWAELQRLYAEELPQLPLYFRADAHVLPRWLKGVTPTGHEFPATLWAERWRAG